MNSFNKYDSQKHTLFHIHTHTHTKKPVRYSLSYFVDVNFIVHVQIIICERKKRHKHTCVYKLGFEFKNHIL